MNPFFPSPPHMQRGAAAFARLFHDRSLRFFQEVIQWPRGFEARPDVLLPALHQYPVAVRASASYLRTPGGQAATLFAVNLLARLFPRLVLDLPRGVPLLVPHPIVGGAADVADAARQLAWQIYPPGDPRLAAPGPALGKIHALLALGPQPASWDSSARFQVVANGDGWRVRLGESARQASLPGSPNPLGAMISAGFGCMEVVKSFARWISLDAAGIAPESVAYDLVPVDNMTLSLLSFRPERTEAEPELPSELDLGELVFVSAGAMANGALYGLRSIPGLRGRGFVSEPKTLDEPDLNRYVMMTAEDLDAPKAPRFASKAAPAIELRHEEVRYQEARSRGRSADLVILGVDHLPSRIDVQRDDPRLIINGATEGAMVCISRHDRGDPTSACLECLTPAQVQGNDTPIPTLGPVSAIAGLLQAVEILKERVPELAPWKLPSRLWVNVPRPDGEFGIRTDRPAPRGGCRCGRSHRVA